MKSMEGLHRYFEYQVDHHPDNIALICRGEIFTYRDLEHRANQWAQLLISQGIGHGALVGLLLHRSIDLYVALLAILKIGAAYVPIDPEYPADRIQYMMTDCKVHTLITQSEFSSKLLELPCKILYANQIIDELSSQSIDRPVQEVHAEDLSYVIYTSGTTGRPKGVAIPHRGVCNYVESAIAIYGVSAEDRVYQGFSIAFDASIEEVWLAFATGATLVVGVSNATHAGAGLAEFLNFHQVTVFSTVPTMLAMLDEELPHLKVLILGGEVCTRDLVSRWHRSGLRIVNTYGPTEATIIATHFECDPNKPITIGRAIPNCELIILDEKLQPVAPGESGELCIGGLGLAWGYINQPELTAKKFISHPLRQNERLYRTGDLASFTSDGEVQFMGRLDEQIKLRGFRIELSEIEAVMLQYPGVKNAVAAVLELVPGVPSLVGYLIAKEGVNIDIEALIALLHSRLPEYMVPALIEMVTTLPTLASGKVDRKHLPKPQMHHDQVKNNYVAPRTEMEKKITAAWEDLFKHSPISVQADFFHDLGGHSLLAAKTASLLRKNSDMQHISMLDLYEHPTIEQLAKKMDETQIREHETATQGGNGKSIEDRLGIKWRHRLCGLAQLVGCWFQYALSSWEFLLVFLTFTFIIDRYPLFSFQSLCAFGLIIFVLPLALFVISISIKWLLLGRIKPGNYRLWGWFYVRWWLVHRIQKTFIPVDYLVGSPLMNLYCRLMGAKIGKNCYIGTTHIGMHDLVTMGDGSSANYNAMLMGYIVEDGWLKVGTVSVGKNCFVGTRAILNINTSMQDEAVLEDLSMLPANHAIPKGQHYEGSPARPKKGADVLPTRSFEAREDVTTAREIKYGLLHYLSLLFVSLVYFGSFLPSVTLLNYFYDKAEFLRALLVAAPVGAISFLSLYCLSVFLVKKILIGTMKPGVYKIKSSFYVRRWIIERLMNSHDLNVVADSLYAPLLMRLFGAKLGKRIEMGELPMVSPDLLTMGDESLTAGSVSIGYRVDGGKAIFKPTTIGKRTFIGNIALLPPGTQLGDGCLIGCLSIPPANGEAVKSDTTWFGSPAVFMPKREGTTGFSEEETYRPTKSLYFKRLVIEFVRIILPTTFTIASFIGLFLILDFLLDNYSMLTTAFVLPFVEISIMFTLAIIAIAIKWILMGRLREGAIPLWCMFMWKYDICEHLYNEFMWPMLKSLLGTPFIAFFLRLLGVKLGKRVYIETILFAEFDLIEVGNDVALNTDCILQTHLFEDRVFKMAHLKVDDGCSIGCLSMVLYNTIMEKNSILGSLSLLMKGEILPAYSRWEGIPAQHASQYAPCSLQQENRITSNSYTKDSLQLERES